jgi:hypothetical protein
MNDINTEKYLSYEIEWITIPTFKPPNHICGHGIELHYKQEKRPIIIGFINGYNWYHERRGLCKVYILSQDSKDWVDLPPESTKWLNEVKECIYTVLKQGHLHGRIKRDIYAWANA